MHLCCYLILSHPEKGMLAIEKYTAGIQLLNGLGLISCCYLRLSYPKLSMLPLRDTSPKLDISVVSNYP
jgi:hypothetical protein